MGLKTFFFLNSSFIFSSFACQLGGLLYASTFCLQDLPAVAGDENLGP